MMSERSLLKDVAFSLAEGLSSLRTTDSLTDIAIRVESETFRCHKAVLAAVSPVFRTMFISDFKEKTENTVELKEISPEAFGVILSLIDAEQDYLTEDNAEAVLNAASILQIECIVRRCEEYLISILSSDNCVHVWKLAKFHSCSDMESNAFEHILKNFTNISKSDNFLELSCEEVSQIISKNELNVLSEDIVFDAVLEWIRHDCPSRNDKLFEVVRHIRFPIMRARYLKGMVFSNPYFEDNLGVSRLLTRGMSLMAIPDSRLASSDQTSFHRLHMDKVDGFIAGKLLHPDGSKRLLLFDFATGKLCVAPRLGDALFHISDILYTNDNIYIFGNLPEEYPALYIVDLFHPYFIKEVLATCNSEFNFSHTAVMMPADDGIFFVVRELKGSKPVRYKISTQSFTIGHAILPCMNVTGKIQRVVIAKHIYMFCNVEPKANCILRCNPATQEIKKIGTLKYQMAFKEVMVEDDTIYVLFEDGHIWKVREDENGELVQEFFFQIPDFTLCRFTSVIHLSKMYFFSPDKNVAVLDLTTGDICDLKAKLPKDFSCECFCKATLPRLFMGDDVLPQ